MPIGGWTTIEVPDNLYVWAPSHTQFKVEHKRKNHRISVTVKEDTHIGSAIAAKVFGPGYTASLVFVAFEPNKVTRNEFKAVHIGYREAWLQAAAVKQCRADSSRQLAAATSEIKATRLRATNAERQAFLDRIRAVEAERDANVCKQEAEQAKNEVAVCRRQAIRDQEDAKQARSERDKAKSERDKAEQERDKAVQERDKAVTEARETKRSMLIEGYRRTQSQRRTLLPTVEDWIAIEGTQLHLRYQVAHWIADHLAISVDIDNRQHRPYALAVIRVTDALGNPLPSFMLDPTGLENATTGLIKTIPEGSQGKVTIAVQVPPGVDADGLRLEIAEVGQPAVAAEIPRYYLTPETQKEKQRRLWAEQLVVSPRFSYGACWLADGLSGDDRLEATTCSNLGIGFTFPLFVADRGRWSMALDFEAIGGWTGNASFEGVDIGGAEGELTRSAKLGRVAAHTVARLSGGPFVPYVRFGVGAQGANYDAQFSSGANPDASFDLTTFFTIGGGLQYRFGEHLTTGFDVAVVNSTDNSYRTLDVSLTLGYGWNP